MTYWRLAGLHGVDLLRLTASTHRYARHSHEGYALGVVEAGAHAFTARGQVWTAIPGRVIIVNPEDAHDGGPAARSDEYSYRMLYLDRAVVDSTVGAAPYFADAVVSDPALASAIIDTHRALERREALLECETRLFSALVALARRHGRVSATRDISRHSREVARAVDYLHEHFAENCSLATLAAVAGVDRFRLLRAFQSAIGLPPHRYQTQIRLRHAKRLIQEGEAPAQVAAAVGFSDQSHLIRKFKAVYGVTPGRYAQ